MDFDKKIQSLLEDFFTISGIRVSIHDTTLKEIYCYPEALTPFCACVQQIPEMRAECIKSDAYAFSVVEETNEPYTYKCKCGLYEAVAPIYNYGKLTGYLMLGQIRDNDTAQLERARDYLIEKGLNRELVSKAYEDVICMQVDMLDAYKNIMTVIAEYITKTNKLTPAKNTLPFLIRKEIINNYNKDLTLRDLSKKFVCSTGTLTAAFKNEYHISIHQFLINTRLEHAADLLKSSDKAVKEISEECGFYDQNHFYKTFKLNYKLSPIEYRKFQNTIKEMQSSHSAEVNEKKKRAK